MCWYPSPDTGCERRCYITRSDHSRPSTLGIGAALDAPTRFAGVSDYEPAGICHRRCRAGGERLMDGLLRPPEIHPEVGTLEHRDVGGRGVAGDHRRAAARSVSRPRDPGGGGLGRQSRRAVHLDRRPARWHVQLCAGHVAVGRVDCGARDRRSVARRSHPRPAARRDVRGRTRWRNDLPAERHRRHRQGADRDRACRTTTPTPSTSTRCGSNRCICTAAVRERSGVRRSPWPMSPPASSTGSSRRTRRTAWDVAAAVLLLEEAGGVATDFDGGPVNLGVGVTNIVASNAAIHADLLDIVNLRRA